MLPNRQPPRTQDIQLTTKNPPLRGSHQSASPKDNTRLPHPDALPPPHNNPHRPHLPQNTNQILSKDIFPTYPSSTRSSPRLLPHPTSPIKTHPRRCGSGSLTWTAVYKTCLGGWRGYIWEEVEGDGA